MKGWFFAIGFLGFLLNLTFAQGSGNQGRYMEVLNLPLPRLQGNISIEEALSRRRSIRTYQDTPLELAEVAQLLWAAQGVTAPVSGFRTAPSAGATYPLEVYLVAGRIQSTISGQSVLPGIYRYFPESHRLGRTLEGDFRSALSEGALGQSAIRQAPVTFIIAAVYARTAQRYGSRAERYVQMEAGHAAQNIALQAVALGLGSVMIGAFHDGEIKRICRLSAEEDPLYLIPVGRPTR
ncbi:MAG: SagB/ThcOx family dehydrogenase [Spirochaetes bacterium]|nr:SagB/ThcOx family dehydrogenase [Spirochaetota bacterium]